MNRVFLLLLKMAPLVLIVTVWQILISIRPESEFTLGSPAGVLHSLARQWHAGSLLRDFSATGAEAFLGFLIGMLLGSVAGILLWTSSLAAQIARPYLAAFGSLPVFALGPVIIFWFGTGMTSKIVLSVLSSIIVATVQAHAGALEGNENLVRLCKAYGLGKQAILRRVIIPSSLVWVLAASRICAGMALIGAVVGEFLSSREGIGHSIIIAEGLYDVNTILAGIISIVGLALLFQLLEISQL